ncbi:MAG: TetR/AcrR family transcriptional regulator [Eubacteriales bacterium]|nr:TetR/AcrR family transcriptional regulator [Eubacteriales bacterium]
MQYSDKRVRTKQKIMEVFSELYMSKDTAKISVKMICEKADINRSTFYTYFTDVFQLQEALEEELVQEMAGKIFGEPEVLKDANIDWIVGRVVEFMREKKGLPVMVLSKSNPIFVGRIVNTILSRLQGVGVILSEEKRREITLAARYHFAGVAALFTSVQSGDIMADVEFAVKYLSRFANEGPLTVVRKNL